MTPFGAATRFHRHLSRFVTRRVQCGHVVTLCALEIGVYFMSKRSRRNPILPGSDGPPITDPHCLDGLLIKIGRTFFRFWCFVTGVAVLRQRRQLALLVVTREARCVSQWSRLERSFLQPERITDILWRLSNELIIRFALRLISLMAIGAICIGMFVVRKKYAKLGDKVDGLSGGQKRFAKTRERVTRRVDWRRFHMTVGTDPRNWTLTREELLSMTIHAG